MAGDYYNSTKENPANRAKVSPSIISQIFEALGKFADDIVSPKKYQDRGSASPATTDILVLNSQTTPPAAAQFNVPENPEMRHSEQHNEKQFRFLGLNTGQGGNKNVEHPLFGVPLSPNHTPMTKEQFRTFHSLVHGFEKEGGRMGRVVLDTVSGKKIIDQSQVTAEPSGVSASPASAPASAPSAPSAPSSSSGGYSGGGRLRASTY